MFRTLTFAALAATVFALAFSGASQAQTPLRDHKVINDTLFVAAVGDEIRKRCDRISARMGVVYSRGQALYRYAQKEGYSKQEISDYLESKPDNDRMKVRRDAYLAQEGVVKGNAESYCRVGEAEIAAGSSIGELLRRR
ncbi:MAG: DUF5333 domain-containing protein [Pseudomonadota bacterium]